MNRSVNSLLVLFAMCLIAPRTTWAVTINTVPVGNPGNSNDPLTDDLYGGVDYAYRIGTYEVTNAQYAEFLNAKTQSVDSLDLFNTNMEVDVVGGISRSLVNGSLVYSPKDRGLNNFPGSV